MTRTRDLLHWFEIADRKYFGNKLPKVWVHFGYPEGKASTILGRVKWVRPHNAKHKKFCPTELIISSKLRPAAFEKHCLITLLHECAHLNLGIKTNHGKKFDTEIKRLFLAGAFNGLI